MASPFLPGDPGRKPQPGVVGVHAQDAGDEGFVGAVALVGLGKTAVEYDFGGDGLVLQQLPGNVPDARRPRRVAAGGTDHDRPDDVEYVHNTFHPFPEYGQIVPQPGRKNNRRAPGSGRRGNML